MSDFHPDTKGVVVDNFLGSLVQSRCGKGGMLQTNNTGGVLAVPQPHWACPCSWCACPPCPHCSGSRLLHLEPSEAGPGLHAPPRSKPLGFKRSGSPQRCRLHWAYILCPSQVRAAQVMRCLASTVAVTYGLSHPAAQFSGCTTSALSRTLRTLSWQRKLLAVW